MSWTSGTWAEVAIGDTVLGGDGYPWRVTGGAINYFGPSGKGESLQVTMERDGAGARTGDVFADKPVKYRATEAGGRYLLSCIYCLRSDVEDPCKLHAPTSPGVRMLADALGMPVPPRLPADGPSSFEQNEAEPKPAAPYVEYGDAERAAAAALKGAGFEMTVIERVMTLDGLTEHISDVHGHDVPGQNKLTRIEYRARLADLHFDLHLQGQERNRRWEPRGRTPHVHPVMDRPMAAG